MLEAELEHFHCRDREDAGALGDEVKRRASV